MEEKECKGCQETKPVLEFTKKKSGKDGLNARCKDCTRAYVKKHYNENKEYYFSKNKRREKKIQDKIRSIKTSASCPHCGENENCCLDFHHINGDRKYLISQLHLSGWGEKKVEEELQKCTILCSNCHRKLHNGLLPP